MYYGLEPGDGPNDMQFAKGEIFTARLHPEPVVTSKGTFPGRFAPHAFDKQVGKVVPLNLEGKRLAMVKVRSAQVALDGSYVDLEYEIT